MGRVATSSRPADSVTCVAMDTDTREPERFRSCIGRFLRHIGGVERLSDNTVRAYSGDLQSYLDWVKRRQVDPFHVTHAELRGYLAEMSRARYSTATMNRRLSSVRDLYRWLVEEGVTTEDAAAAIVSPKRAKTLPRTLTEDEAERLLEACDGRDARDVRDRAFLELLYATGARISEVSKLDVRDVDLNQEQVRLEGKGSKTRIVPIYDLAAERVRSYVLEARPGLAAKGNTREEALFLSTRGNRMSADALRTVFERRAVAAGGHPTRDEAHVRYGAPFWRRRPEKRADASWTRRPLDDADIHTPHD